MHRSSIYMSKSLGEFITKMISFTNSGLVKYFNDLYLLALENK